MASDSDRPQEPIAPNPALEKELDELRKAGVSEEGIAAFRRLYPQFKAIFKWED